MWAGDGWLSGRGGASPPAARQPRVPMQVRCTGSRAAHTGGRTMGAKVYGVRFECPGKSPSEPLHGAEVRLHNSPRHAPRSVYGLGPAPHRPGGSTNPRESPVLTAQPPRYSSPAAPRDMSPGHRRERRFKRPQRYRRASARPQYLPKCLPESGDRARRTLRPSRPRALQRSVAISACGATAPLRGNALPRPPLHIVLLDLVWGYIIVNKVRPFAL
jgi:hypothetical protein